MDEIRVQKDTTRRFEFLEKRGNQKNRYSLFTATVSIR